LGDAAEMKQALVCLTWDKTILPPLISQE